MSNNEEPPNFEHQAIRQSPLNTNSAISLGLAVMIIAGVAWLKDGQKTSEMGQQKLEYEMQALGLKVDASNKNIVTEADFVRWTNRMQRENNNAGNKIIVPEPK